MKASWKYLLVVVMLGLLGACSTSTEPGNDNGDTTPTVDKVVGDWQFGTVTGGIYITTSSAQTAYDVNAPTTGSLVVTGDYTGSLQYIVVMGGFMFQVTNQPFMGGSDTFPQYELTLMDLGAFGKTLELTISPNENTNITYSGDQTATFTWNAATNTLTLTNVTLDRNQGNGTVTINGTVTAKTVNVPANISTKVTDISIGNDMPAQISFKADSTYLEISQSGDTSNGTWSLEGETLTVLNDQGDTNVTLKISATGTSISAVMDDDFIQMRMDEEGTARDTVVRQVELVLGLDPGSLVAARMKQFITMIPVTITLKSAEGDRRTRQLAWALERKRVAVL